MTRTVYRDEQQEINYFLNHIPGTRGAINNCIDWAKKKMDEADNRMVQTGAEWEWERWRHIYQTLVDGRAALETLAASTNPAMEKFEVHHAASEMADGIRMFSGGKSDILLTWAEFAEKKNNGLTILDRIEAAKEKMVIDDLRRQLAGFWSRRRKEVMSDITGQQFGTHMASTDHVRVRTNLLDPLEELYKLPDSGERFLNPDLMNGKRHIYNMLPVLEMMLAAAMKVKGDSRMVQRYQSAVHDFKAQVQPYVDQLAQCRQYDPSRLGVAVGL